ncbi:Peroxidase 25 [Acorus calamus]|uniref:peroxidase n=1 Tax=Acorus calamus TaxID=4465 RepID=A0AAV9EID8_ACOCL|nr:Peroxidase 25 [Acorus calamus]
MFCWFAFVVMCWSSARAQGGLSSGFYSSTCPQAEATVRSTVETYFNRDPTIAAGLLRLHFHDCFVQGCDGSVLISGASAERAALPNQGLRGFEVIDDAKAKIEASCPGVVSCADILALAARDAVDLLITFFYGKEPVKSAHTIGQTDCLFFRYRLYNFTATSNPDPSIDQDFLVQLQSMCPAKGDPSRRVALDPGSPTRFDVGFFKNVRDGKGVLESDQRLWGDPVTQKTVQNYAGTFRGLLGLRFDFEFAKAMVKMGGVGVKTGAQGEIRRVCSRFN